MTAYDIFHMAGPQKQTWSATAPADNKFKFSAIETRQLHDIRPREDFQLATLRRAKLKPFLWVDSWLAQG